MFDIFKYQLQMLMVLLFIGLIFGTETVPLFHSGHVFHTLNFNHTKFGDNFLKKKSSFLITCQTE